MGEYISRETAIVRAINGVANIFDAYAVTVNLRAIPAADAVERPRWVSVTERLPEERVWVLCQCRAKIREVLRWQNGDWYHDPQHSYMSGFVIHWMPLPEPPKEEA